MKDIFEIATSISTPLALSGFFAAAFFFIVKIIITPKEKVKAIGDSGNERTESSLKLRIVNYLFILSLIAMILGFIGFIIPPAKKTSITGIVFVDGAIKQNISVEVSEIQKSATTNSSGAFNIETTETHSTYTLTFRSSLPKIDTTITIKNDTPYQKYRLISASGDSQSGGNGIEEVINVKGHVYWEDTTPIPHARVIPSFYGGVQPTETVENGSFQFIVKKSDVSDPVIFSIVSNNIKGTRKANFEKEKLSGECNIYLSFNKPIKIDNTQVLIKTISKATTIQTTKACDELIAPLRFYLDSSAKKYDTYTKYHKFSDAKSLYDLDIKMNEIISKKSYLIPTDLNKDIDLLIQHFNIWTIAFEKQTAGKTLASNSYFQVQYTGNKFPQSSAQAILNYVNTDCK